MQQKEAYMGLPSVILFLWHCQESNRGHANFQSAALPTELQRHQFWEISSLEIGCKGTNIFETTKKKIFSDALVMT